MTAGELIQEADELRPNAYSREQKLRWLRRLDGQLRAELLESHLGAGTPELAEGYEEATELLAPFPWGEGLYTAWLFCQIDLHNGEIQKYNQSLSLLAAAWRSLADWINRGAMPKGAGTWKM